MNICQSKFGEADCTVPNIGMRGKPIKLLRFLSLNQFLGGVLMNQVRIPPAKISSTRSDWVMMVEIAFTT